MTQREYNIYSNKAELGLIPDAENPIFILSMTNTSLLAKVLSGEINLVDLARIELQNRGLNEKGEWVGFNK